MKITIYRKPYRDELLFSWIMDLAEQNLGSDYFCTYLQTFLYHFFPKENQQYRNGGLKKERPRLDCLVGMTESIRYIKEQGYEMPDLIDLMCNQTPVVAMGIARKSGYQAKYIETFIRPIRKDKWDMPTFPYEGKTLKFCEACVKEDDLTMAPYFRTWHNIPGVTVCAVHKTSLMEMTPETAVRLIKHQKITGYARPCKEQVSDADIRIAEFAKALYEDPGIIDLQIIRVVLKKKREELGVKGKTPFQNKFMYPFDKVVMEILEYFPSYEAFCEETEPFVREAYEEMMAEYPEHVVPVSAYGPVMKMRCGICGYEWYCHPYSISIGFYCPVCDGALSDEVRMKRLLSKIGDGQYEMLGDFEGIGALQKIRHRTCGQVSGDTAGGLAAKIWGRRRCSCEIALTKEDWQKRVDEISNEFEVLEYYKSVGKIKVQHKCGESYITTCQSFLANPKCRICSNPILTESEMEKIIRDELGEEYEILGGLSGNRITFRHKPCGIVTTSSVNMIRSGWKCRLCTSRWKNEREAGLTLEGRLYMDIREHLKTHKVWSSRKHLGEERSKECRNALDSLVYRGFLHRISSGYFSDTEDVTVYDIVEETYIRDKDGTLCGNYTGETMEYMIGIRKEEPQKITLESELLTRKADCTVKICGRRVVVKGI